MKTRCVTPMWIAKIGYIVMALIFCAVGFLFIARPDISVTAMGLGAGIALIVFGVVKLVGYFSKDLFRLAFQFDLEFGVLLIVLGIVVLIRPADLMNFLSIALGVAILLDGLFKIQIAWDSKRFGIKSWWLHMAIAVVTGTIGVLLVARSAQSAQVLTALLGASLLAEGILNLYTVLTTVIIVNHQRPDTVEIKYEIR